MNTARVILALVGIATHYAPGVMESVVGVRQAGRTAYDLPLDLDISKYDGLCAFILPEYIGQEIWVHHHESGEIIHCLVVDTAGRADGGLHYMLFGSRAPLGCSEAEHYLNMVRSGELKPVAPVEFDWQTASRLDAIGRGAHITVTFAGERRQNEQPISRHGRNSIRQYKTR